MFINKHSNTCRYRWAPSRIEEIFTRTKFIINDSLANEEGFREMIAYSSQDTAICFNYRHMRDSWRVHHDGQCQRLHHHHHHQQQQQQQPSRSRQRHACDDDERLAAAGSQATSFHRVRSLQVGKLTPAAKTS